MPTYIYGVDLNLMSVFSNWGGTFVFIFYLLSGYGIGYGFFSGKYRLSPKSLASFFIKRFLRLAPAYYVVIAVCYTVIYRNLVAVSTDTLIRYFTFRANNDPFGLPFGGNHAMVSTEMQFYLVAPFLFAILLVFIKRVPPFLSALGIFLVTLEIKYYLALIGFAGGGGDYMQHIYAQVLGNIDIFVFGMFLSYLVLFQSHWILKIKKHISPVWYWIVFAVWIAWANWFNSYFVIWTEWHTLIFQRYYVLPFLLILIVGWLIISSAIGKKFIPVGTLSIAKVAQLLVYPKTFFHGVGVISYAMYLWQYPIIFLIFLKPGGLGLVPSWPAFFCRFVIVVGITLIVSLVSYALIERPCIRLSNRISRYIMKPS